MQTIQLRSDLTLPLGEVVKGFEQLNLEDLEVLFKKLLAIRAKKMAPSLGKRETELFRQINATLPESTLRRFDELDEKRELDTLTEQEHEEFLGIVDETEELQLKRTECLAELSKIRGVPFRTLVEQLGIKPRQRNG